MPSNYDITEIKDGISAQRFIHRITDLDEDGLAFGGATTDQVVAEGIIGSPEGRALGSPGDLRYRQDVPQVWQKITGIRTITGWQLVGGVGSFEAPVAVRGGSDLPGDSALLVRADHRHRLEVEGSDEGVAIGARPRLNFTGSGVVVADNPGSDRLDVAVSSTGYVQQIDVNPLDVTINNTTTLTLIYSVVLAAASMGKDRAVRVRIVGDYTNTSGVGQGFTLRIRLGGTNLYLDASGSAVMANSLIVRGSVLEFFLTNRDIDSAQIGGGRFIIGAAVSASTGIGGFDAIQLVNRIGAEILSDPIAIDTSLAQTLDVSFQHANADPLITYRKRMAFTDIARI